MSELELGLLGEFGLLAPELLLGLELELLELPVSPPCVDDEELLGDDDMPLLELVELLGDEDDEPLLEPIELDVSDGLLDEPEEPLEAPVLSAVSVWSSIWPEACRPCCCWNFFSAAFVFGPAMPSTGPALKPLSFRAC